MPDSYSQSENDIFVYTVSELNQDVRTLLERGFPQLWLEGEISNFSCPSSGHWYFSLKDARAQVRCAMFKNKNKSTGFTPKQGDHVLVKARISLYEARGEYQILVDTMEEAGTGALQQKFEALKKKLQKEGFFDMAVKKPLPELPKQIGIITSPTGAAVRDIISVLKRRFPAIPLLIFPVSVQGNNSAREIANAIHTLDSSDLCDVIILARGGGSLEDLWSFNEEIVARAIFHCHTPIVSGVGHEIDFTIADFVADVRAPTPSAAAELVAPDVEEALEVLTNLQRQMTRLMKARLAEQSRLFIGLSHRLKHPSRQLNELTQQLDELELRLSTALRHQINYKRADLQQLSSRLSHLSPASALSQHQQTLSYLKRSLHNSIKRHIENKSQQLKTTANSLHMISPLATLDRGYAIVVSRNNNCIVRSYNDVKPRDEIEVKIANGQLSCTVNKTTSNRATKTD